MSITAWDKNLETGIQMIDEQHQNFLSAANLLLIKYKVLDPRKVCREALSTQSSAWELHFKTEETYMSESGYPEFRTHQAMHSELSMALRQLRIKAESTDFAPPIDQELLDFLQNAVQQHMLSHDVKFAEYYRKYKAKK